MNRKNLIELFRKGMNYPLGQHHFLISRFFEITVRPNLMVELDEYEGFVGHGGSSQDSSKPGQQDRLADMYHVGRSVLDLKSGRVTEEQGKGWGQGEDDGKRT